MNYDRNPPKRILQLSGKPTIVTRIAPGLLFHPWAFSASKMLRLPEQSIEQSHQDRMPILRGTVPAEPLSFPHHTGPVNPPALHSVGYYPVKYFLDPFSRLFLSLLAVPDPGFDPATLCRISAVCQIRSLLNYLRPAPRIPRADIPGSQSQGNNQQWHFARRSTQQLFRFGRLAIYFVSSLYRPPGGRNKTSSQRHYRNLPRRHHIHKQDTPPHDRQTPPGPFLVAGARLHRLERDHIVFFKFSHQHVCALWKLILSVMSSRSSISRRSVPVL